MGDFDNEGDAEVDREPEEEREAEDVLDTSGEFDGDAEIVPLIDLSSLRETNADVE
jgi:hypothetical protein